MHVAAAPFSHSSGPHDARIALVGEAFGGQEALIGQPFIGTAGQELTRLLAEAGIKRSECFLTNVIASRPYSESEFGRNYSNDFDTLCGPKASVGDAYEWPPLSMGKYLRPEFLGEVERLRRELIVVRPNVIVALGAWPGQPDDNDFGPPPGKRKPKVADVFS